MSQSIYTKLTPRNRTPGGYTQLWLAPDHILLLSSRRFSEDYQRFAFTDIQSIVVTQRASVLAAQIVVMAAGLAWIALGFAFDSSYAKYFFTVTGILAALWGGIDMYRSPRCRCVLQTRVSKERLAPVSRMNIARKFLTAIRPRIEAMQGALPTEQFATIETPADEPARPEIITSPSYLPEILFFTFLINAVLILASIRYPTVPDIPGIMMTTLFAEALLIVVALLRRKGRDPRIIVYMFVVLSILGFAFDVVTIGGELFRWYMTVLDKAKNGEKTITPLVFFPKGGFRLTVAWGWRAALGTLGLVAAFFERRQR